MIAFENFDSSFFTIESDDLQFLTNNSRKSTGNIMSRQQGQKFMQESGALTDAVMSKALVSLTVTERMEGLPQGSIQLYDPDHIYSRILRSYMRLKVSWGYRKWLETPDSLLAKKINLDEISGSIVRRGLEGMISNPSGGGDESGVTTYNCNFTSMGYRGPIRAKRYEQGTKESVISQAMNDIGVDPFFKYIDFSRSQEKVNPDRPIMQDESSFAFLVRLAKEWQCGFKIGWSDDGRVTGIFMESSRIRLPGKTYPRWVGNCTGESHVIGYKGEISNIKSYTWENNEAESGAGDDVRMEMVNGQITFKRYLAQDEKVISYKLNPDKIKAALNDKSLTPDQQTKLGLELLSAKDFKSIERFFDATESSTAPQGYGYRIKAEMLGNPLFSPPNKIKLNNGFPDRIGGTNTQFYLYSVTHKIDITGYHMSIEVVDAFTLSPTGVPIF
jgi:hypothetical protein